jgi:hypothetical protein
MNSPKPAYERDQQDDLGVHDLNPADILVYLDPDENKPPLMASLSMVLVRKGDQHVKPFIYAMLTFVYFTSCQGLMRPFADGFPWLSLIETLNSMTDLPTRVDRIGKR